MGNSEITLQTAQGIGHRHAVALAKPVDSRLQKLKAEADDGGWDCRQILS